MAETAVTNRGNRSRAGAVLHLGRNRILQVEDDDVRSKRAGLFKRARIGRGQEQRAAARSDRGLSHWPETRGPRADAALRPDRPPALWAHPKFPPRSTDRGRAVTPPSSPSALPQA